MAKTSNAVKTRNSGKTNTAKPARVKRTTKKAKPSKRPSRTPARKKSGPTAVGRVAGWIPGPIERISYVRRTLDILDQSARKRATLRRRQAKLLGEVWGDLNRDVKGRITDVEVTTQKRIDGIAVRVRDTRVVQEASELPELVTETFDAWLDRVGLVRKSVFMQNVGRKALPARTK